MLCYDLETYELREIPDSLVSMWQETGNPKLSYFKPAPPRPSEAAVWNHGEWVAPANPVPESVSARQIRLWLVGKAGISLAAVDAAIEAIPDQMQKELTRIEWDWAPYIERSHPMLVPLASALGLDEAQVTQAFREASTL